MSGPLELYRTTMNLRGLAAGTEIEIDPSDPAWAGDIRKRRVVPVVRPEPEVHEAWDEPTIWPTVSFEAEPQSENGRTLSSGVAVDERYLVEDDGPGHPSTWVD